MLSNIVEAGVRRGLERCQKLFENDTWNCPVEMYKKLPIIANTALPFGKCCCSLSAVLLSVMCMIILRFLLSNIYNSFSMRFSFVRAIRGWEGGRHKV